MSADLVAGFKALAEAFPDYDKARAYYEGDMEELFASPIVRRALAREDAAYQFRLARIPVNVVANRIQLQAVSVPNNPTATERIKRIWDANDMEVQNAELHLRTLEYGDGYLMVWPVDEDDDQGDDETAADDELAAAGVQITYHSPMSVRVMYDPEHPRRKVYAIQRWREGRRWRADVYYPDRIERFATRNESADEEQAPAADSASWLEYVEDEGPNADQWPLPNPFGEIPFFHYRTAMQYGRPEHFDAYSSQDAITKLLVTHLTTVDSQAFSQRVALLDKDALDQADSDPDWDDDADAPVQYGANRDRPASTTRSGPGVTQTMAGVRDVKEFRPAEPGVFIAPVELHMRLMAQLTDTPFHYFDPTGDAPSGESLRTADKPLADKVINRERMLRGAHAEMWRFALKVAGIDVDTIDVRWKPVVSIDDAEGWAVIEAKQRNGVPMRQALLEAGYTSDQVDTWLKANQEDMDLSRRVEILTAIGEAVQKLGTGVATGVIDQGQVAALIQTIVGQATPELEPAA